MLQSMLKMVAEISRLTGWDYTLEYGNCHNHPTKCWNLQVYANQYGLLPSYHIGGTIEEAYQNIQDKLQRIQYNHGITPHEN